MNQRFLILSFVTNIPTLTELLFCDPFKKTERCLGNQPFPVILTKANSSPVRSLKGTFSSCISLAPVLTFCSKCLALHSYAVDFIYPSVNCVPILNPRAKRTDVQDSGQKVPFSTLVGWFAWAREVKQNRQAYTYSCYIHWEWFTRNCDVTN